MKAGFAKAALRDWRGFRSPGHSARTEAAAEYLDTLWVRAAVFADVQGSSRSKGWYFFLLADVIALDHDLDMRMRRAVGDAVHSMIPSGSGDTVSVVAAATHTHTGPPVFTLGEVEAVGEARHDVIAAAAGAARQAFLAVKEVVAVQTRVAPNRHAVNRRLVEPGGVVMKPNPLGAVDPGVVTFRFLGSAGPIGSFTFLPMHPTVLAPSMAVLSGDVSGCVASILEERGDEAALVFQGASGDVRPRITDDEGAFAGGTAADLHRIACDIVGQPAGDPPPAAHGDEVTTWAAPLSMTFRRRPVRFSFFRDTPYRERAGEAPVSAEPPVNAISLITIQNQLAMVFLPGEPFAEIAAAIQRISPYVPTAVAGHTGATVGYIPTAEAFYLGGYEVDEAYRFYHFPAPLSLESADRLVHAASRLFLDL